MVFDNIFGFAGKGAGLFSVTTDAARPQPGAGIDFEDAEDDTYDDTSTSLFNSAIHGASARAKIVREESPEARAVLGFLGSFIRTTQASAGEQAQYAQDPGSVSAAASAGMRESSATVTEHSGLQKNEDLESEPKKSDYTKPPKAPEAPKAAKPAAEEPSGSE
ncbi:hypothetical protein [Streptomyces uncialis]|uniref:Uncharacterized protein n=1 Tax=Streptomyces uncialis TaxID=1048205 RepID=A0A1Q4VG22_9ACTN|nr:hypothetical protein [Streptomyces uncialis]MCX4660524.1 hypothetical protein [Streptomyces uncialis]OKH96764.1 hypothetical protein AB852_05840 [Streptomyces uncialis]WTE15733.1 hypothetical protein OG924_22920 [Streptomyces uncialis]